MSHWTPTRQRKLKEKNFLRFPWCLPIVCNEIVKINWTRKQEFYIRRISLSNMDWIYFLIQITAGVTEIASSNINSGFQRRFGHINGRWNYFFFFPRVSFWMPCDFTVRAPSWTGCLAHFASISCVQFCSPGSGTVFIFWHSFTTDETVASLCLQLVCLSFFLTVFNWPTTVSFVRKAPF